MPIFNTIQADLDANSSDYGKFVFNMVGYGAATDFQVGITGPGSYVVKAFPASSEYTGSSYILKVAIPTDASGDFLQGSYEFRIKKDGTSSVDETKSFSLSYSTKTMVLTAVADCYSKSLVITDASVYPTGTVSRSILVDTPVIAGNDDVADATYTDEETIIDMVRSSGNAYSNVTYNITGNTTVTTSEIDGEWDFGYVLSYTATTLEVLVRCDTDACGIISCVNTTMQSIYTKACSVGGFSSLPKNEMDTLIELQMNLSMYNYYNQCRDNTNALVYYDKLKEIVGDCGCEESGPTVISDSTYTYIRGYSAYELWIQEGNTGTIDDFFSALFPITDWVEIDDSYFLNSFKQDTSYPLMYRMTKTHLEFKGAFDSDIGATSPGNPGAILDSGFDPIDVIENGFAQVRNGAEFAGWFYKDASDSKWYVNWNANFDRTDQMFLTGQIPIDGYLTSGIQFNTIGWTEIPSGQYESGNSYRVADPLFFRTDGNYLMFKGSFTHIALLVPGVVVFDAAYWTSVGVAMEEDTTIAAYNAEDNILIGYAKVESGTLRLYPTDPLPSPAINIQVRFDGIIPLQ
jgi:hypothetical protein